MSEVNPMRQSARVTHKVGEKDELLRYQIHSNKEDNEMLDDILGSTDQVAQAETKAKDGELISTDKNNMTMLWPLIIKIIKHYSLL